MQINEWQQTLLGSALSALGEAISETARNQDIAIHKVGSCIRQLNEFLGSCRPSPNLNQREATIAASLHTYMRKCMDDSLSVILYRMIDEDRAQRVWFSFIRELIKTKKYETALTKAKEASDNGTSDDYIMLAALEMWEDDFAAAMEWIGLK